MSEVVEQSGHDVPIRNRPVRAISGYSAVRLGGAVAAEIFDFRVEYCACKVSVSSMLDRLDDIPWKRLTHAYGPAEDVPDLLRRLRTAPAEMTGEQSPLWHLYGNVWHQGTVYEATAYAVPFLIELAASPLVPDRLGILGLLAAIATGSSFRDVHGNLLNEPDFAERKAVEIKWVE